MRTIKELFYKLKLEEEKLMMIKAADIVIEDEVNQQYTIGFFDGSIVQYDKKPESLDEITLADSVIFFNELEPELTPLLVDYLKPLKRAKYDSGEMKVVNTFSDNSSFSL